MAEVLPAKMFQQSPSREILEQAGQEDGADGKLKQSDIGIDKFENMN